MTIHKTQFWVRFCATLTVMFLLALALIIWPASAGERDFDEYRYLKFYLKADKFARELQGCPLSGFPPEIRCSAGSATFDAKTWRELKEESRSVFGVR